jgi:hypothetical protein
MRHDKRMKITALIPLAALFLSGCITYHTRSDGISRARFDEAVVVNGPKVTPLALLEDSRCPAGVQCVWAGQVRISARIETGKGSETRELTLGKPVPVADGQLQLVEVAPGKRANITLYPEDYRFGFTFAGGL